MGDFELAFGRYCAQSSLVSARLASISCTITFAMFSLLGFLHHASPASIILQILVCMFMLVAFSITFSKDIYLRAHNILVSGCVIAFIGGMLGLNVINHDGYTFRDLVPIVIIPHTLHHYLRLSFIYTASLCFMMQAWYSVFMPFYYGFNNEFITLNMFMVASSLIALSTNYSLERRNKMEYLHACDQKRQIKDSCKEVETYSSKGLLLANMTQELTTPLRGICGHAQLLYNTRINETEYYHIKAMYESSQLLLLLTNNIIQTSKMEDIWLEEGLLNLCDIVEQAIRVVADHTSAKRLKMSSYVSSRIPTNVIGDAPKVLQILVNLLGNAVKFTSHGCIHVNVLMELETESTYTITIMVKDTGVGIEADKISHLQQWFRQSPKRMPQGSAVGLIIVNQLANLMGGELEACIHGGCGSIFRVTLNFPKHNPPNQVTPGPSCSPSLKKVIIDRSKPWPIRVTPLQVLVVDSSDDSRSSVCSYLRDSSPHVCIDAISHSRELVEFCMVSVSSPEVAMQVLSQCRISVVIIIDWMDQSFSQLLLELESNPYLAKTQLVYACQENSPKLQALSSRSFMLRLPLAREFLLQSVFAAAASVLFGHSYLPDEASRNWCNGDLESDGTTGEGPSYNPIIVSNLQVAPLRFSQGNHDENSTSRHLHHNAPLLHNDPPSNAPLHCHPSNESLHCNHPSDTSPHCAYPTSASLHYNDPSNASIHCNDAINDPSYSHLPHHDPNSTYLHLDDTDTSHLHDLSRLHHHHEYSNNMNFQRDVSSTFSSGLVDASCSLTLTLHHLSTPSHKDEYIDSSDFSGTSLCSSSSIGEMKPTNSNNKLNNDSLSISPPATQDVKHISNSV